MTQCIDPLCGYWAHIRGVRDVEENLAHWEHRFGIDWAIKVTTAAECCWAAEIRVVVHPNDPTGPDRGFTTYAAAADDPLEAICRAWVEMERWLTESIEELPVREKAT